MVLARNAEIDEYEAQARQFLVFARQYLADGILHQACEKGWGAAAHMAKAVALANGWEYDTHSQFRSVLRSASIAAGEPEIRRLRRTAYYLHQSFYELGSLLDADDIAEELDDIEELLELLTPLLPD